MFQQASIFGGTVIPSRHSAQALLRRRAETYRRAVQDGLLAGRGLDMAHAESAHLLAEARAALLAAGYSDGQATDAIAREFHA